MPSITRIKHKQNPNVHTQPGLDNNHIDDRPPDILLNDTLNKFALQFFSKCFDFPEHPAQGLPLLSGSMLEVGCLGRAYIPGAYPGSRDSRQRASPMAYIAACLLKT